LRSLKHQILLLMLGSLCVLGVSFIVVFGWHMRVRAVDAAIVKANTDLATGMEIINLTNPGPWHVQDGTLYKGQTQISHSTELVDHLADLTGDTVTLFLGDTRVATGHATEKVNVTGPKEIGDLAAAFNQMVERLEGIADEMSKVTMPKVATVEYVPSADVRIEESDGILNDLIKQCSLGQQDLPKGLNQLTLKQIVSFLRETYEPVSAENVAEGVSLTRVTVRR
jgi:methyl-accepting chemotaxis protein